MADRNEAVMEMVRSELERDPGVSNAVLREKATKIDPAVAEMPTRRFNALYPLQVKRALNPGGGRKAKRGRKRAAKAGRAESAPAPKRAERAAPASDRDAIRGVFLDFASDFAKAESRQEIVGVLSSVDAYVDRVQKLLARR